MSEPVPIPFEAQSPGESAGGARGASASTIVSFEDLVRLRESRGLSEVEIAQRIKVSTRQIQALERGDLGALPGLAFVLGVLRLYGRVLQVDVGPLVASLGTASTPNNVRPVTSLQEPLPRAGSMGFGGGGRGSLVAWIGLVSIATVSLVLFFGRGSDLAPDTAASGSVAPGTGGGLPATPAFGPAADAGSTPPAAPLPSGDAGMGVPADAAQGSTQSAPQTSATPAAQGSAVPSDAPTPVPGEPLVWVSAREDAWIEIRQADGRVLHTGTVGRGQSLGVDGQAPFALIIGNASEVDVRFRGRAVSLQAGPNNIARMTLP